MPQHAPSNPELADRISDMQSNIIGRLDDLKTQMSRLEDKVVWRDTYQADMRTTGRRFVNVEGDVEDVQDTQRWMRRVLIANLVLPVLVLVIGTVLVANLIPA